MSDLAKLNQKLIKAKSDKTVVMFFITKRPHARLAFQSLLQFLFRNSPLLFAKPWMAGHGYTEESMKAMQSGMARITLVQISV